MPKKRERKGTRRLVRPGFVLNSYAAGAWGCLTPGFD